MPDDNSDRDIMVNPGYIRPLSILTGDFMPMYLKVFKEL